MKKRNVPSSPRLLGLKKQRQKIFIRKVGLSLLAILLVLGGLSYISHHSRLKISNVEVKGSKVVEAETIKTIVENKLEGKYLWLFPKTNIFLYPKGSIKDELRNQLERLSGVALSIETGQVLKVSTTERTAAYTWCGEVVVDEEGKCYFLDVSGYIFDEAPYFSGEVYFKFYGKTYLTNGVPSGSYFSKENFDELVSFKETLEGMELEPTALAIVNEEDLKIFLSSGTTLPTGPEILFKKNSDFQKIAENLETALTTEPLQSEFRDKYPSLLYIDLRFGNKVYYKFK